MAELHTSPTGLQSWAKQRENWILFTPVSLSQAKANQHDKIDTEMDQTWSFKIVFISLKKIMFSETTHPHTCAWYPLSLTRG